MEGARAPQGALFAFHYLLFSRLPLHCVPMADSAASAQPAPRYRRIVLKVSGEALKVAGTGDTISPQIVQRISSQIKEIHDLGVEIAIVIGGGNIWRGLSASHRGMERTTADYMGMLATVINGLALQA